MTPRTKKSTTGRTGERRIQHAGPLLLVNIGQLLTLEDPSVSPGPRRGHDLAKLGIVQNGAVLCSGGKIVAVGTTRDALRDRWVKIHKRSIRELDCQGKVVVPGFVDSHTHPVFAGPRLVDFEKRIAGASYEHIAEAGGGIRASIDGVRSTPKTLLVQQCLRAFNEMLAQGTTTVEAKSGYGLSYQAEIKSLEIIRDTARQWPGTVVPTLLGAHVVPPEFSGRRAEYVRMICRELAPEVAHKRLASFIDVFCETGAFTVDEAKAVLRAGIEHGLGIRIHVGQLTRTSLAEFAQFSPSSLDHLDHLTDEDVASLAGQDTVATLLPGANYFLGLKQYPPARRLIDSGIAVALATDYNPGTSPTPSVPFIMSLACTQMKMSPAEAISAATINGAWALKLVDRKGSVAPGKDADLAIFDVRDYREIPYWFAAGKCSGSVVGGNFYNSAT